MDMERRRDIDLKSEVNYAAFYTKFEVRTAENNPVLMFQHFRCFCIS
jgi:hypothetical protein